MSDHIRVDYHELDVISRTFRSEELRVQRVYDSLATTCFTTLQRGGWVADSAGAYYREMEGDILPAVQRLADALAQAAEVTLQIKAIFQQAEEEASACLRGEDAAESEQTGGAVSNTLRDAPTHVKVMGTVEQNNPPDSSPDANPAPDVTVYLRYFPNITGDNPRGMFIRVEGAENPIPIDNVDVSYVFSGNRAGAVILFSQAADANMSTLVEQLIAERNRAVDALTEAAAWQAVFNVLPITVRNVFGFEDSSDVARFVAGAFGEEYITGGGGNLPLRAAKGAAAGSIIQGVWELGSWGLDEIGERVEISNPEYATVIETGQTELYDEVVSTIHTEYSNNIQSIEGVNVMIAGLEAYQPVPGPTGLNDDTTVFVYLHEGQTYLYVGVGDFEAGVVQEVYNAPIMAGAALMVASAWNETDEAR